MSWRPIEEPVVTTVLEHDFGLESRNLEWLDRESTNGVFRAWTSIGPVVLKRLGRPGAPEWLEYQARTMDLLYENGFPVEPWLTTVDGRRAVLAGGYQWQVGRFVEGRAFTAGSELDVDAAAKFLDDLHTFSMRWPMKSPASPVRDAEAWLDAEEPAMAELERTITQIAPQTSAAVYQTYQATWARARETLSMPRYQALPKRLAHGEFVGSNVLFGETGILTVLDWDGLQVRPRVCDLARACLFFARRARGGIEVFEELVPRFLIGATKSSELTVAELEAIIPFLELYFVPTSDYLRTMAQRNPSMVDWYLGWSSAGAARVRQLLAPILAGMTGQTR